MNPAYFLLLLSPPLGAVEVVVAPTQLYFSAAGYYAPGAVAADSYQPGFTKAAEYAPGFANAQGKELE